MKLQMRILPLKYMTYKYHLLIIYVPFTTDLRSKSILARELKDDGDYI